MRNNRIKYATAFISSTFTDMKSERNLIMYSVLPRVKHWAFKRGIIFDIVDLRWGINNEQSEKLHQTVRICLERVKDCDPLFICLLGERYGWIPDQNDFNQSMFENDISDYIGASATELEIMQALNNAFFDSSEKSCIFLFREELCYDLVDKSVVKEYKEQDNTAHLNNLKKRIEEKADVLHYTAEFSTNDDEPSLENFTSHGLALEDALTDRIIQALIDKYHIDDSDPLIFDNPIVHQQFHLTHLTLTPKIDRCVEKMRVFLNKVNEKHIHCVFLNERNIMEHQVAHLITEEQDRRRIIFRFMGIDNNMLTVNDLIKSMAYEITNDDTCLTDLLKSTLFLKDWFERTDNEPLLILAGIKESDLMDYINVFSGIRLRGALFFVNSGRPTDESYIEYTANDLKLLAQRMLHSKAKTLLPEQLDFILRFTEDDYELLKTTINYLCTFASYDSVSDMISELSGHSAFSLTHHIIDKMAELQNRHVLPDIFEQVIGLLCYTPLPITRADIVNALYVIRENPSTTVEMIENEVDFSLCFAKDYIEEYDSRFIIRNKELLRLFHGYLEQSPILNLLPLVLASNYLESITRRDENFSQLDGQNLIEILKWHLSDSLRTRFMTEVVNISDNLYHLAKNVTKRDLIELFKVLALQEMGHDTDHLTPNASLSETAVSMQYSQGIIAEKIFSVSRRQSDNNIFSKYYNMMFSLSEKDLYDKKAFTDFIDTQLSRNEVGYHHIQLPCDLNITSHNSEVYTIFNSVNRSYQTYFCVVNNGFLFTFDALAGNLCRVLAVPPNQGEPISVFYCNHTLHIIFEKGVITAVNLDANVTQTYRFEDEASTITHFKNYFNNNGFNIMIQDAYKIKILRGLERYATINFGESFKIASAYLTFDNRDNVDKIIIINTNDERCTFILVDFASRKYVSSFTLYGDLASCEQDLETGDLYVSTTHGTEPYVISVTEENELDLDITEMDYHLAKNGVGITSKNGNIYYNDVLIATDSAGVVSTYATRNVYAFATKDNKLYCIDKKC